MTESLAPMAAGPQAVRALVRTTRGFVFDLDGTIYLGGSLLDGAREATQGLRRLGKKLAFVSNKPIGSRDEYARKLKRLGVPCSRSEVVNSSLVLARYLRRSHPGARCFPVAEPPVVKDLLAHGLSICDDPAAIDLVVVSFDRTFDYRKLNIAYQAVLHGAGIVATNPDRTCPMPGYDLPDAACMIAAIEACTGVRVSLIAGKPSEIMLREVLDMLDLPPGACAMVGDRAETDMAMARRAGLVAVLVMTGVTSPEDLGSLAVRPDYVIASVADIARACELQEP
jgi:arabinose operon protein AraL